MSSVTWHRNSLAASKQLKARYSLDVMKILMQSERRSTHLVASRVQSTKSEVVRAGDVKIPS